MVEKQFNEGEVIFQQGAYENTFFRVECGHVGIFVDNGEGYGLKLTDVGEGGFFGELGLLENYSRSASAIALADGTKVTEIADNEVQKYLEECPANGIDLMKHIGSRLRAVTEDYNDVNLLISQLKESGVKTEDEGFVARMKKHLSFYKGNREAKDGESAESRRMKDEGFKKNVEAYKKGTIICKEGETGDCMYEIHGGTVGVYTGYGTPEEKKLTILDSSDFFGEMGMLENEARSATAVALEDNTIVELIYMKDLEELFEKNPPKIYMILTHLASRLRTMSRMYIDACADMVKL